MKTTQVPMQNLHAKDVQTSALAIQQTEIPPVPGGGSWKWTGAEWIPNIKPADAAVVPAITQE